MRLGAFIVSFLLFAAGQASLQLHVVEKKIKVNGKEALVYAIEGPDGKPGLELNQAEMFDVNVINTLDVPTVLHWHGLILPNKDDGAAFVTQFLIYPGLSYLYQFPLLQTGTFWMHSHVGLQEQRLLAAPLIIYGPEDSSMANQEVVVLLADFSFRDSEQIYADWQCGDKKMKKGEPDVVEIEYDAFLANSRTLEDPTLFEVEPGSKVRLRIINGASATNFFVSLGNLSGEAIAIDGHRIEPLQGNHFELAIAQRIDIIVAIPDRGGAFPILMQGEWTKKQTGIVLATKKAPIPKLSSKLKAKAGILTNKQEARLRALYPLPSKPVDRKILMTLEGGMMANVWTINGRAWPEVTPPIIEEGQRVAITFKNESTMSHPMHLHGHVFEVTEIDGQSFRGAMRDTVLVTPQSSVTIEFDANNPGVWPVHCHLLYHMEAGMFTVIRYKDFIQPL